MEPLVINLRELSRPGNTTKYDALWPMAQNQVGGFMH
jgi:hypothetical protein